VIERDLGCSEDDRAAPGRALPAGIPAKVGGCESPLVVVTGGAGELDREGRMSGRAFRACILVLLDYNVVFSSCGIGLSMRIPVFPGPWWSRTSSILSLVTATERFNVGYSGEAVLSHSSWLELGKLADISFLQVVVADLEV
jgi:hypothetical protein